MRRYIYADESGNFDFSRNRGASRYFILATVALEDHSIANRLYDLRRDLAWRGLDIAEGFHATEDRQSVRDAVFEVIREHDFRVDATILDKPKADPKFHLDEVALYKLAWFFHMKFVSVRAALPGDELFVVAASIGIRRKRENFRSAIQDTMNQVWPAENFRCAMWPAATDASLQVADYCAWAIQRKWESDDLRSYHLISGKINSEFDLFARGTKTFY